MWTCPQCAAEVDDDFECCWQCGTSSEGATDPEFVPEIDAGEAPSAPAPLAMPMGQVLFSFNGRISRGTFWATWLCVMALSSLVAALGYVLFGLVVLAMGSVEGGRGAVLVLGAAWVVGLPFLIAHIWVNLALQLKRWHDIGYSGAVVAFAFIPWVNLAYALIAIVCLGFIRGTTGPNEYGPDPLPTSAASSVAQGEKRG